MMNVTLTPKAQDYVSPSACTSARGCSVICSSCRVRLYAVCAALSEHEIIELERLADHHTVGPKHTLFLSGDKAGAVYTVTSGTVRLQRDLSDGRRQVIGFAIPGDFIGLAMDDRFSFSADSLTEVTLCSFDRQKFSGLMAAKPALMSRLHQFASHELGIAQEHMVILGRRRAEERVVAFLVRWRERLERVSGRSATVQLPMGRQDIADHLGLTIETVSRTFARLMRDKILLDVPQGVRILDEQRLRDLLSD